MGQKFDKPQKTVWDVKFNQILNVVYDFENLEILWIQDLRKGCTISKIQLDFSLKEIFIYKLYYKMCLLWGHQGPKTKLKILIKFINKFVSNFNENSPCILDV